MVLGRRSRTVLAEIDTAPSPSQSRRSLNKITVDPGTNLRSSNNFDMEIICFPNSVMFLFI